MSSVNNSRNLRGRSGRSVDNEEGLRLAMGWGLAEAIGRDAWAIQDLRGHGMASAVRHGGLMMVPPPGAEDGEHSLADAGRDRKAVKAPDGSKARIGRPQVTGVVDQGA